VVAAGVAEAATNKPARSLKHRSPVLASEDGVFLCRSRDFFAIFDRREFCDSRGLLFQA
jgi:hypothetical protein